MPEADPVAGGELVAMSLPGARRVAGWLFWIVFPAIALAAIVLAAIKLSDNLGLREAAVPGKFTVTQQGCSKHLCSVTGTFVGDNGVLLITDAAGDPRWKAGETRSAFYDSGAGQVLTTPAKWDPSTDILSIAGGATYLIGAGWLAFAGRRKRPGHYSESNRVTTPG